MKHLGRLATLILLALNFLSAGLLLFSAYSPYVDPEVHPLRACMGLTFPVFLVLNICFLFFWIIFRLPLMWLSLVALLICAPQIRVYIPINFQTDKLPKEHLKILSYNVMSFSDLQKIAGKNPILTYLQESEADIICIQEFMVTSNRKYLTQENIDKALKDYPYKHIHKIGKAKGSTNRVACYSKLPIVSATPVDYESRSNGSVSYEIAWENDTITLVNNHMESNKLTHSDKEVYEDMLKSPEAQKVKSGALHLIRKLGDAQQIRAAQARAVARVVENSPHPYVVVCGDFNDSPISYTHRIISEQLDDAFVASGNGPGISYNQNKFYFRIDHMLISKNLKAYQCTVDRSIKSSDHYPIWCYISKR